jgi:hypothetical protein
MKFHQPQFHGIPWNFMENGISWEISCNSMENFMEFYRIS